jgi:hypothetical protein
MVVMRAAIDPDTQGPVDFADLRQIVLEHDVCEFVCDVAVLAASVA